MAKRLKREFFLRDTKTVAKELLGKVLVRKLENKTLKAKIVETEAYLGVKDKACHSFGGRKTERNKVMYEIGGKAYVYFVYGMHYMFNVVTREKGIPEAVLIRGILPLDESLDPKIGLGPGKLTKWLKIDLSLNGEDLVKSKVLWIEEGEKVFPSQIKISKRVGIDYAQEWRDKPLRFYIY